MNKEKAQINETKRVLIGKATTMQSMEMHTPVSFCTAWKAWHKNYS